jgi:hypothetical protein
MSQDIGNISNPNSALPGLAEASALVIHGWVEDELSDDFAGGGVDDADVEVVDQHQDMGSGGGSADADVVESAVVAEADLAVAVDDVAANSGLRLDACVGCAIPSRQTAAGGF